MRCPACHEPMVGLHYCAPDRRPAARLTARGETVLILVFATSIGLLLGLLIGGWGGVLG